MLLYLCKKQKYFHYLLKQQKYKLDIAYTSGFKNKKFQFFFKSPDKTITKCSFFLQNNL